MTSTIVYYVQWYEVEQARQKSIEIREIFCFFRKHISAQWSQLDQTFADHMQQRSIVSYERIGFEEESQRIKILDQKFVPLTARVERFTRRRCCKSKAQERSYVMKFTSINRRYKFSKLSIEGKKLWKFDKSALEKNIRTIVVKRPRKDGRQ